MSWGSKIAILYIGFILMIAALIVRSSMENTDLVSDDYYDRELHFQEQIDGSEALLNSGVEPTIQNLNGMISVRLPENLGPSATGTITFYRPDNAKLDREFPITSLYSEFDTEKFAAGNYQVKLKWVSNGQSYFFETAITVQ